MICGKVTRKMSDFKYDAGKLDSHETLKRCQDALVKNNPILALQFINQYFMYLDVQFHVDSAIQMYKEKLQNDE
jgi:hypothetical protein